MDVGLKVLTQLVTPPRSLLLGLVLFVFCWDLWAISVDQRFRGTDTYAHAAFLVATGEISYRGWVAGISGAKGPVAPLLALWLVMLLGKVPMAARLLAVLAHGALTVQTYDIARRMGGGVRGGLWAALACSVTPVMFGMCRLSYYDVSVAVAVAGLLQLLLRLQLDRLLPALATGALLAGGLLTKATFFVYIVAPGIWFVAWRLRRWRQLIYLGAAAGAAVALAGPWLALVAGRLAHQTGSAIEGGELQGIWASVRFYLRLPGFAPIVTLAAVGGLHAWWRGRLSGGHAWLGLTTVPTFFLLTRLNPVGRFIVPLLPLPMALAGVGFASLLEELGGRARQWLSWALAVSLCGGFALMTARRPPVAGDWRELTSGMLAPDRRQYLGFLRAVVMIHRHGNDVLLVHDSRSAEIYLEGLLPLWRLRGVALRGLTVEDAEGRLARGESVTVLLLRMFPERELRRAGQSARPAEIDELVAAPGPDAEWLRRQARRESLGVSRDPDGVVYRVYRILPATRGDEA